MSHFLVDLFTTLNSQNTVRTSGFLLGFIHAIKFNKQTLDHPLVTVWNASWEGVITTIGASIVGSFLPPNMRFFIPLITVVACIHYKISDLKKNKKKRSSINIPSKAIVNDCSHVTIDTVSYKTIVGIDDEETDDKED